MHVRVSIFGSGPRTRRIAATLVRDALADGIVRTFDDRRSAEQHAVHSGTPVVLLDGRVGVEPQAFRSFAQMPGNAQAFARTFDGAPGRVVAAVRFEDGAALLANAAVTSVPSAIGAWLEEPEPLLPAHAGSTGVDVHGYGKGPSGFATASRNLMIGLTRAGVNVNWLHWFTEAEDAEINPADRDILARIESDAIGHDRAVIFHPPTHTSGQAFIEAYSRAFARVPYACMTMFETDGIPAQWPEPILECSRLWVPSAFNVETFASGGIPREMIDLVPIGLDIESQPIDGDTLDIPERRSVAFLSVFEWTYRKGWDVLFSAWASAFTRDDDACLIVRTSFRQLDIARTIHQCLTQWGFDPKRVAPIIVLPKKLSQAELVALYRTADAYVLPTRGEGFGLPYLEAMALGLPVIGTAWSGMTDFVDARTGYLIDARLAPITSPLISRIVPLYKNQRWAEPSVQSTVAQLRRVYEHRDEAATVAARGTVVARTQFNRTRIGRIAAEALGRIEPHPRTERAAGSAGTVAIAAEIYAPSGAGGEARGLLAALESRRYRCAIVHDGDRTWSGYVDRRDARRIRISLSQACDEHAPAIVCSPTGRTDSLPARSGPTIARTVAKADTLRPEMIARLRAFDEVWVPSQLSATAFELAGLAPERIAIIPPAIDVTHWTPQLGGLEVTPNATTLRLVTVVDWDARSGWDVVLGAFLKAFEPSDDVALAFKIRADDLRAPIPNFQSDVVDVVRRTAPHRLDSLGKYQLAVTGGMSQDVDYAQYLASFDAFVCGAREIGWGRPVLEAMACGVAVVAPRRGNHRAFVSEDNAFLFDARSTAEPTWFEPDVEGLAHTLRRLYERRGELVERTRLARRTVVSDHALASAGAEMQRRLDRHVEQYHAVTEYDKIIFPAEGHRLGIIVDARFEPAMLERALERIESATRSTYEVAVVSADAGLSQAFSRLSGKPYVAYLRSDAVPGPSWDDFLIDALRTRPHVGFAVPKTFDVPGIQGDLKSLDPADVDVERGLNRFSRSISTVHTARGSTLTVFSTFCVAFEQCVLRDAFDRLGADCDSVEALLRATLKDGAVAWCAFDSVVQHGGSAPRSVVDLRAAAHA
jgi:glycosyltransferase involved in cell wall biosynthesis